MMWFSTRWTQRPRREVVTVRLGANVQARHIAAENFSFAGHTMTCLKPLLRGICDKLNRSSVTPILAFVTWYLTWGAGTILTFPLSMWCQKWQRIDQLAYQLHVGVWVLQTLGLAFWHAWCLMEEGNSFMCNVKSNRNATIQINTLIIHRDFCRLLWFWETSRKLVQ